MTFLRSILLLMMLFACANSLRADPPTTQASEQSSTREKLLTQWIDDLSSRESSIRQTARINLMSINPDELPLLRKTCQKASPLSHVQLDALKEIVGQLFLAGELLKDRSDQTSGFVGVRLGPETGFQQGEDTATRVVVYQRIMGFVGYRMLQDGDVVVGVLEVPDLAIDNVSAFQTAIRSKAAGDEIHLKVMRAGKEIAIPIKLDPRPEWVTQPRRMAMRDPDQPSDDERVILAQQYWATQFGVGIDPDLSADSSN